MTVSKFIKVLVERGFIHQATDLNGLDKLCYSQSIAAYIGFDCTADSLHVGSLTQIMMLRHLQKTGHKPIVLMGGGTTKVGDPSGKDSARPIQPSNHQILHALCNFMTGAKRSPINRKTLPIGPKECVNVSRSGFHSK